MNDRQMFDVLVATIKDAIPGFEVGYKDENWVSKLLGVLAWVFNPKYMTEYITTRYPKVLFPSRQYVRDSYRRAWKILAHEWVHLKDRKQQGVLFNLKYALPQLGVVVSLIVLLAIWVSNWWLLALLGLGLAAPIPSPGRMKAELRGYTMSMAVNLWRYGSVSESTKGWIIKQFTSASYYFMWPFEENMKKRLDEAEEAVKTGEVMDWPDAEPFKSVRGLVKQLET